jgi:hypothetical protein
MVKHSVSFALAGEVVKTQTHAKRILADAVANKKDWLIPQARNVAILLGRAAKGGAA